MWDSCGKAMPTIRIIFSNIISPPIFGRRSRACCVLPLGFRRKTICLFCLLTDPTQVFVYVSYGYVDNRPLASAPFVIIGVVRTAAIAKTSIPLIKCGFISADSKGFRNCDLMRGVFLFVASFGAHDKGTDRHDHKLGTFFTVFERLGWFELLRAAFGSPYKNTQNYERKILNNSSNRMICLRSSFQQLISCSFNSFYFV